jgi:hypothetical protein
MATPTTWPFGHNNDSLSSNQMMVGKLLATKEAREALSDADKRSMQALGIEVAQLREEAGMTFSDAMQATELDRGFICMLESGSVLPTEVTVRVLAALAYGLSGKHRAIDATWHYLEKAMKP